MEKPKFDVTAIGESMLRLSVPIGERLENASQLDAHPGGTEANLVGALSRLGRSCAWVSGLPNNALGQMVVNQLRIVGLDVEGVIWSDQGRLGTYYVEFSAPPRATQVIYDRADSCAARLRPEQIDWDHLLDTRILHLTGITPALSPSCLAITEEAIRRAKAANVAISFDINYRQKLWSEEMASQTLIRLIQGVDILFCGRGDAERLFNAKGTPSETLKQLAEISDAKNVVVSLSHEGAIAWDGEAFHHEPAKPVQIIDRPGAGDALAAGVLHRWLEGDIGEGLKYGTVMAALCLSQHGDMLFTTKEEVESLLQQADGGVRVTR